ncbi:MAG: hypothetical protein SO161_08115 [Treponema sp.]|nr:hypothetical protein [Treponema sp.]
MAFNEADFLSSWLELQWILKDIHLFDSKPAKSCRFRNYDYQDAHPGFHIFSEAESAMPLACSCFFSTCKSLFR